MTESFAICPEPEAAPWLWPWGTHRNQQGELLTAGGVSYQKIVETWGSPLYLFDLDDFSQRVQLIATAMAEEFWDGYGMNGASVYYAGKAFLCTALGKALNQAGLGIDTASYGELCCALSPSMGVPAEKIGLHGNNKSSQALKLAIEAGIGRIVVDSLAEISLVAAEAQRQSKIAPIMIRLTTGVHAGGHHYIATAHEDQKFGLSLANGMAWEAIELIKDNPHLHLIGLHSHIGSQIADLDAFNEAAKRIMNFRAQVLELGMEVPEVDLGGGLAISYTGEEPPSALDYARGLAQAVRSACEEAGTDIPHISIEPGRWLAGPVCVSLYRVGTIKDVPINNQGEIRRYVSVDGGMSDNIRPVLYQAQYVATRANAGQNEGEIRDQDINADSSASDKIQSELINCRIVGGHCESGDILVSEIGLPVDIKAGDILVIPATGAYGRSMASNYNWFCRPGVLGISAQGYFGEKANQLGATWIYRPDTVTDLLSLDPFHQD